MNDGLKQATIFVEGMSCARCEQRIERALSGLPGVRSVRADAMGQTVRLFVGEGCDMADIKRRIEAEGYPVRPEQPPKQGGRIWLGVGALCLAGLLILANALGAQLLPSVESGMGYGMLFLTGLLTSLHCVAMCGGINLSQCVREGQTKKALPAVLYNAGRVLSYTLIGALVGAVGAVLPISSAVKGGISVLAGVFMILMGLNLLKIPGLSRLLPRMPKKLGAFAGRFTGAGPFAVGLLNGLMPCGPLQSMQLYALGTGSAVAGALSMLCFALGTVPLMFALGSIGSLLSQKSTRRMMAVSALLVIALGGMTLARGLNLAKVPAPAPRAVAAPVETAAPAGTVAPASAPEPEEAPASEPEVQKIASKLSPGMYPEITVKKGIPVEWTISAGKRAVNGCNEVFIVPDYNLEVALHPGDNVVSFTPDQAGDVGYSCWMGMIQGVIHVQG